LAPTDGFVGMTGFGLSAPAEQLFEHFSITSGAVTDMAQALIKRKTQ